MDKPLVTIKYKTADGSSISVEVSPPVKELLEQSDRQIRSQRRQDRRHINYTAAMDGLAENKIISPQPDIVSLLIKLESYEQLYSAFSQLSTIQRRRLRLYYAHNLTYRQIAELEHVDQAAISHSIKRAIAKLQENFTNQQLL